MKSRGGREPTFHQSSQTAERVSDEREVRGREDNAEGRGAGDRLGLRAFLGVGRTLFPWRRVCSRAVLQGFGCEGVWGEGGMIPVWGRRFLSEVLWVWLLGLVDQDAWSDEFSRWS